MSNQRIKYNGINGTGTTSGEGVEPSMHEVPDQDSAVWHQATGWTKEKMKWKKAIKKVVIECWKRSEPTKRKYRQRIKKIWSEMGVCPISGQRLADQARKIPTNKWPTDIETEEIRRPWERNDSRWKVKRIASEIIKHSKNKRSQPVEKEALLVEQEHGIEQHQETYCTSLFPEVVEILVRKTEMESCNKEEKELLMRVVKEIRCDPERMPKIYW